MHNLANFRYLGQQLEPDNKLFTMESADQVMGGFALKTFAGVASLFTGGLVMGAASRYGFGVIAQGSVTGVVGDLTMQGIEMGAYKLSDGEIGQKEFDKDQLKWSFVLGGSLATVSKIRTTGRNIFSKAESAEQVTSNVTVSESTNLADDVSLARENVAKVNNSAKNFSGGTPTVDGSAYSPDVVNARSAEFYKMYGDNPARGTMTNVEARQNYLAKDADIPSMLNRDASLEQQARQAVDLRNANRTEARELMSDRITADRLAREEPNKTFEELVDLNKSRSLSKDQVHQNIIDSSQRTRASVNQMLLGDLENTPLQNLGKPNGFDSIYQRAPAAKIEIDMLADQIAAKFEGTVIKAPIKSETRAIEKIRNDYGGDATRINDLARNTIVVPERQISAVAAELERMGAKVKVINGQADPMGYSGVNSTIKTNAGISGEIQVNSPQMIFAKEKEALARDMLGNDTYQTIADRAGVPGGLGHQYYEQRRILDPESLQAEHLAQQSRNYYDQVRASGNGTISMGGANTIANLSSSELTALRTAGLSDAEIAQHMKLNGDIYLFRGTSNGWAGSPGSQATAVSASTDPYVATVFALEARAQGGQAVVQFGGKSQIGTFGEGNWMAAQEREVGVQMSAAEFAQKTPNSVPVDVARQALADMGLPALPYSVATPSARSTWLDLAPKMTPEQVAEFLKRTGH